jgi:hypothetical protein
MRKSIVMAVLIVTALVALVVAVSANESRKATTRERAAITRAVHSAAVGGINKVPRNQYKVTRQKVSTVSRYWALADMIARPKYVNSFQNASVLLIRLAGTGRWTVVDVGTADVGCGIAPTAVLARPLQHEHALPIWRRHLLGVVPGRRALGGSRR